MMSDLPLNALRAFEVAARSGSFVQAGAELGVTSAAVSQQVKGLEAQLGKRLFLRIGNRIVLTDAGRAIYPRLEAAFADLAALTAQVREGQGRAKLVVSVLSTISDLWLMPRLAGFSAEVGIEIRVEDDPVVFARDGVDLRVTYGAHYYPDHRVDVLFSDQIVPVASPRFATLMAGEIADLPDEAFIHTDWGPAYATQPVWSAWLSRAGSQRLPDMARGLRVGVTSLAIAAAREGIGVALAPERIAAADIAAGRLVVLGQHALPMPWDYVLVYPNARARRGPLQALVAHLRAGG
ncbi:MAG: LysR substrate-binding domain-containing protein [Paracoccaceae bacterium]